MSEQFGDTQRDNDDAIWQNSITLSADETRDAKIHVTLRLDANMYRAILAEKKAAKERTVTSTIERLLSKGLESTAGSTLGEIDAKTLRAALRNVLVHSIVQDAVLEMVARHVKPRSSQDRRLMEEFKKLTLRHEDTEQWLTYIDSEQGGYRALVQHLIGVSAPEKKPHEVTAQRPPNSS